MSGASFKFVSVGCGYGQRSIPYNGIRLQGRLEKGLQNLYAPVRLRSAPPYTSRQQPDSIADFTSSIFIGFHLPYSRILPVLAFSSAEGGQSVDKRGGQNQ